MISAGKGEIQGYAPVNSDLCSSSLFPARSQQMLTSVSVLINVQCCLSLDEFWDRDSSRAPAPTHRSAGFVPHMPGTSFAALLQTDPTISI